MNPPKLKNHLKLTSPLLNRLTELWRWWINELIGILPKKLQAVALPGEERLYLETHANELVAGKGTSEITQEIGRFPLSDDPLPQAQAQIVEEHAERSREIILTLPTDKVLTKSVTLPLVAETNLREVLGFEMDRQTPFNLSQVYYDHILCKRDSKAGTITVDLVVTPRNYLDKLLNKLRVMGFQPHQIGVHRESGTQAQLDNLLPEEARRKRPKSTRLLNLVLAVVSLALLTAIVALPLMDKIRMINTLEAEVELTTQKAEIVQRLGDEVEQLTTGSDFLVKKKRGTPLVTETIGELTHILPDNTWINRLTIKGVELQIQGYSTSAAGLIPLIESSDKFHNPRFRSSVTTSRNSESERFHLSAEITRRVIK